MAPRLGVALSFALLLIAGAFASAQQLARLHVQGLALAADTLQPKTEQPFDVTLTIRVREPVSGPFENVILPQFGAAEGLGDTRVLSSSPQGTVYRETLRLVAHARGPLIIGPAYLDAIDARDGKPKRFISNVLRLNVAGGPQTDIWTPALALLRGAFNIVLLLAAAFVIISLFRRRARVVPQPIETPPPVLPAIEPSPEDAVAAALRDLRERRDRRSVLAVRKALWASAGAHEGETLGDVLRRPSSDGPGTRRLLTLVERATFIEDARLPEAIADVLRERESTIA